MIQPKSLCVIFILLVTFSQNALFGSICERISTLPLQNHNQDSLDLHVLFIKGARAKVARISFWYSLLDKSIRIHQPIYECKILAQFGMIYRTENNHKEAMIYFDKALALAEEKGYKSEMIPLINAKIGLLRSSVDKRMVLDLCYQGLKIAESIKNERAAIDFYANIAIQYFFIGDFNKALNMHFKCLKLSKDMKYDLGIANALIDIGSDYQALGNYQMTCKYYLSSREYANRFDQTIDGASIYNSIASAYEIMHESDSAYKYSFKAYKIGKEIHNKKAQAGAMDVMAKALFQKGDIIGAEKMARETIEMAKRIPFIQQVPDLALFLKTLYLKTGDYKKAFEAYSLYISLKDSLSNESIRKQALQKEFAYTFEKTENQNKLLTQQNQIQSLHHKYTLIGSGILVVIILIIIYLSSRQKRIGFEQQRVELQQKLLRTQMNPHFIFNCLNAIQHLIVSRQNESAENYLSKFSRLIRDMLESSVKESISVEEEVNILRGYIEMESIRFKQTFSFLLTVNPKINQRISSIPHMMIQPFIENAIWHGLLPKKGDRSLTIYFEPKGETAIKCTIEDNGLGRSKSGQRNKSIKKKSLAMDLINQRIRILQKLFSVGCKVEIEDKEDSLGNSLGTKVILVLPIMNR